MERGEITPTPSFLSSIDNATPQSCCSFDPRSIRGGFASLLEIETHEATRELQQMQNRFYECLLSLKDTVTAVEMLREENLELVDENLDLKLLIDEEEREEREISVAIGASPRVFLKAEEKGKKMIGGGAGNGSDLDSPGENGSGSISGSGSEVVSGSGSGSGSEKARGGGLPKSISIRSRGFLVVNRPAPGGAHRLRLPASPALHGNENEPAEVEVDVYNQGTSKTELCNKWGETGECPYGDRCQFAHGISEMRPVIRHPRYKTQLCRMIGSSGGCPYGHRCHFRHALAPRNAN